MATAMLASCAKTPETHARIAVATNFLDTAQKLEAAFEAETNFTIDLVSGSTGQLYTQIVNGAPYDAFLSADAARITRLLMSDHGVDGTRMTYALGRLVLYGAKDTETTLREGRFKRLAMANPKLAPYGMAAEETLNKLQLSGTVSDKIVYGQNVGQAYGFVQTGNAELGFVALSQMKKGSGNYWIIPERYYGKIWQDSVLLSFGKNNKSAIAFLSFLKSRHAQSIIKSSGYEVLSDG
ncbi:MAG: molybdate ABC transporter substrate-binding protein [Hellea sp.]